MPVGTVSAALPQVSRLLVSWEANVMAVSRWMKQPGFWVLPRNNNTPDPFGSMPAFICWDVKCWRASLSDKTFRWSMTSSHVGLGEDFVVTIRWRIFSTLELRRILAGQRHSFAVT